MRSGGLASVNRTPLGMGAMAHGPLTPAEAAEVDAFLGRAPVAQPGPAASTAP